MNASILNIGSLISANILTVECPTNVNIHSMGHPIASYGTSHYQMGYPIDTKILYGMSHLVKGHPIDINILNMGRPIHANILAMGHPTIKWDIPLIQIYSVRCPIH